MFLWSSPLHFVCFCLYQVTWGFYAEGDKPMFAELLNMQGAVPAKDKNSDAGTRWGRAADLAKLLALGHVVALALQLCACPTGFGPGEWLWFQLGQGAVFIKDVLALVRLWKWSSVTVALLQLLNDFLQDPHRNIGGLVFVLDEAQTLCVDPPSFGLFPVVRLVCIDWVCLPLFALIVTSLSCAPFSKTKQRATGGTC